MAEAVALGELASWKLPVHRYCDVKARPPCKRTTAGHGFLGLQTRQHLQFSIMSQGRGAGQEESANFAGWRIPV